MKSYRVPEAKDVKVPEAKLITRVHGLPLGTRAEAVAPVPVTVQVVAPPVTMMPAWLPEIAPP